MVVRKKILYVHHGKGLGGAPISLLTLIKGLDFTKYQPLVIFLYDSTAMELFKNAGIEVLGPINLSDFSHTEVYWFRWYHFHRALKALFESAKSFFVARQKLLDIKPDLIHLNTSTLTAWGLAAKQLNIPIIWHIRESLAAGYLGIRRQLNKKIIAYCASTIVPICKIVLYNPVDTTRFIPATKQEIPKKQYLLFLGGLSLQKGTNHMLRVFEQVFIKNPNTILIIAGEFHKPSKKILSPEQRSIHQAYALYEKLKNNIIVF